MLKNSAADKRQLKKLFLSERKNSSQNRKTKEKYKNIYVNVWERQPLLKELAISLGIFFMFRTLTKGSFNLGNHLEGRTYLGFFICS